jgi:uncharacterized membrane protein YtjA (UPF0391 family)
MRLPATQIAKGRRHALVVVFADDHAERDVRCVIAGSVGTDKAGPWFYRRIVIMMSWAITFLVIALIAAVLGFGGIAGVAIEAAKIVFIIALILFAISAVVALVRGRSPSVP